MQGTIGSIRSKVLTFMVGSSEYGIALEWVCGVRDGILHAADEESDRLIYRGMELPVLDLSEWFGRQHAGGGATSLMIVGRSEALAAARIDSPGEVVGVAQVRELPALCRTLVEGRFSGVLVQEDRLVLMVDPVGLCRAVSREHGEDRSSHGGDG